MRVCLYLPMSVLLVRALGVKNQNYEYLFELDCAASRRCACVVRVVEIRIQELKAC
jgi:hypothetical protein